jgi:hypothetical protein
MAAGVDAVKAQLVRDFGSIKIHESHDANTKDTVLDFQADKGLPYKVRVTREYDDDYASGQLNVHSKDLELLSGLRLAARFAY